MKNLVYLLLLLLVGCGHSATLEQLEAQALITGDWSAVEEREAYLQRRDARLGRACPAGSIQVCESTVTLRNCRCADKKAVDRAVFGSLY